MTLIGVFAREWIAAPKMEAVGIHSPRSMGACFDARAHSSASHL